MATCSGMYDLDTRCSMLLARRNSLSPSKLILSISVNREYFPMKIIFDEGLKFGNIYLDLTLVFNYIWLDVFCKIDQQKLHSIIFSNQQSLQIIRKGFLLCIVFREKDIP